jgi:hypothetical protein
VGATDHVCWVLDDDAAFEVAVRDFVEGGVARGERLLCVGERVIDALRGDRTPIRKMDSLLAGGGLEMLTVAQAYEGAEEFDPARQLEFYDTATRRALRDGYQGLRVVADVTPLAGRPSLRPELLRWEHLADEYAAHGPGFSAMCAYSRALDEQVRTEAASAHPLVHATEGLPAFRMFHDRGRLIVAGSIDTFSADLMSRMLAASPVTGPTATLDLGLVDFMDVAACRVVAQWARGLRRRSIDVEVEGAPRLVHRMWQILALAELAPVSFVGLGS